MKKLSKICGIIFFLLTIFPLASAVVLADTNPIDQVNQSIGEIGGTIGLPTAEPRVLAIRTIQWVLGSLGLIAVVMIIYGGFTWMTSGGNAQRIETAKKVITYAVVGLIIMILSWAFVTFVISQSTNFSQ